MSSDAEIIALLREISAKMGPAVDQLQDPIPIPLIVNSNVGPVYDIDFEKSMGYTAKYIRLEVDTACSVEWWVGDQHIELPWNLGAFNIYTISQAVRKMRIKSTTGSDITLKMMASSTPPIVAGASVYAAFGVPGGIGVA